MTEFEKDRIWKRYKELNNKVNYLESKGANLPQDVLDMVDELQAFIALEISKSTIDGQELLRIVDARATQIENILKNYE